MFCYLLRVSTFAFTKRCQTSMVQFVRSMSKSLTISTLNTGIKLMEYAVRGPLVIRAGDIKKELDRGEKKPFTDLHYVNIGDCHAVGQVPLTFIRQVISLTIYPKLFEYSKIPEDAKQRAKIVLNGCKGKSVGSYSDSPGIEIIRKYCAEYIQRRDGYPSNFEDIVLSTGASEGIKDILKLMICDVNGKKPGVMVPIPMYPLYSATIVEYDMHLIGYYLNESKYWALDDNELERSITEAKKVSHPRAIVVINPGNPTGQVLTKENIEGIIKFAYKHNLFILADEVYQYNIYAKGSQFYSFKKVANELGEPYKSMEIASFMSCSKGFTGECGLRAGYIEILNMDPEVKAMFFKYISAKLCASVIGQVCMSCVMNPPQLNEPSYELFMKEKTDILNALKLKAEMVVNSFNSLPGLKCNPVQGAMYAFPQINLPPKAIEAARKVNQEPDVFYAFQVLENTGICLIPGSGFGQQPGTYHFRSTILPSTEKMKAMLQLLKTFQNEFYKKYS